MPQSKKRKPHARQIDYVPHKKKRRSAVPVAIVFFGLLAAGIAWFSEIPSTAGIIAGGFIGAVIGFIAGKQMDKTFGKK